MKNIRKKSLSLLLSLTVLMSTFLGLTPVNVWASSSILLFEDTFQNPQTTSQAWSINAGTWDAEWSLKKNPTETEKDALFYERKASEGYLTVGDTAWSDYTIETKVYMPTGDSWINLRGRVQADSSKYYQMTYNPGTKTIGLEVVTASGTTTLKSYSKQLNANQWYTFKIAFNGSTINCYLDGEKIINVVNSTYTSGKVGLRSNWGSMYVSEYRAKSIPVNTEALSCTAKTASSVTLDWSDITGATSYTLYRAENNDSDYKEVYNGAASNYEDTNVTQGTPYYYKMTYTNEEESQYSSSLRVIPSETSYAIRLDETAYTLNTGKTHATKVTRENEDTSTIDVTSEATYSSLDESVATVNAEGVVTAVALGSTKIKVTYDGKDYEVNVTVANDRVVHYTFDEGTGTEASSSAGSLGNAILKNGAQWLPGGGVVLDGKDDYIELPQNILNGLNNVTITAHVYISPESKNPFWIFNFGSSTDPNSDGNANYLGFLQDGSGNYRVAVTKTRWSGEKNTTASSPLPRGIWKTIAYSQEGKVGRIYIDGVKLGETADVGYLASDIINTKNFIGRAPYVSDNYVKGKVSDFTVYNRTLTDAELQKISAANKALGFQKDVDSLSLGDISAVKADLKLPTQGEYGTTITWASSNIAVIGNDGKVMRPASNAADAEVVLTATITDGEKTATKQFIVKVIKAPSSTQIVALDKEAITLYNLDDLRGNMTLPTIGENGSTITWESSPSLITPTGEVTRPNHGDGDKTVTLTATIKHEAITDTREFSVIVRELPKQEDLEGYLFTYFIGDGKGQEQMFFALSEGNTPLKWQAMNDAKPVLTAKLGEEGLRDPVIVRSPEGDKFYLIATDLQIAAGKGWGAAQTNGSRSIFVWESSDLVNWSKQRLMEVSPELAGCTWAPEIIYDDDKGEYVVYWASKIYADESKSGSPHHRIMYTTTRDFYTFSPAKEYFNPGYSVIDTVMIKNNGKVYRFTKDERDNGTNPGQSKEGKMIFQEVGSSIFANDFTRTPNDFVKKGVKWVEGPLTFKDNLEDKWYLFVDEFGGRGYIPFYTTDLGTGEWIEVPSTDKKMPSPAPRHGTILPLTASEYARLQAHIPVESPERVELVTGVNLPASLSVQVGQVTELEATVMPETADNQEVNWESSDATIVTVENGKLSCLKEGQATITVKTKDGGYMATCKVTVNPATNVSVPVTNVTLNTTQLELKVGKERTLVATVEPTNATLKAVKWESLDPNVAKVDENGIVHGVGIGTTQIVVTTLNEGKTAVCNVEVVLAGNEALYKLDETHGITAQDTLENKADAQLKGGVTWTQGIKEGAAYLNGSDGYIVLPDNIIQDMTNMTIQMWVKPDADNRWARIFDFGTGAGDNMFFTSYGSPGGKKNSIGLHLVVGSVEDTVYAVDNFRLPLGDWAHLAITFEGTTCIIYMNGEEIARNENMRVTPSQLSHSMNYIGKSKYPDPYFKGAVDEFSIQERALTQKEIKDGIKTYLHEPEAVTIQSLQDKVSISTQVGQAPILPNKVDVTYSMGMKDKMNVKWEQVDASKYAKEGTFEVKGTVNTHEYQNVKIPDRADPWVYKHTDGYYYFTASYTDSIHNNDGKYQYIKLVLRRAKTIEGLNTAEEKVVYSMEPLQGTRSPHIWAPEIHYINGKWYIYYTQTISSTDQWAIRPHVIECEGQDPMTDGWKNPERVKAAAGDTLAFSGFSLDHTYFEHNGRSYLIWAQNNPNSNLYIAEMENPYTLKTSAVCIAVPTYSWEIKGYRVNEGPSVIKRNGNIYVSYSASATDANYAVGFLTASEDSNLLDANSWEKTRYPVLISNPDTGIYGPGHSSFTVSEDGTEDILIYHGRPEKKLVSGSYEPLYDSGRHAYAQKIYWDTNGRPYLGIPKGNTQGEVRTVTATITVSAGSVITPTITELKNVQVTTVVGTKPQLPLQVEATYSDTTKAMVNVVWDTILAEKYAQAGTFIVEGTVEGTTLRARTEVTVKATSSGGGGSGSSGSSSSGGGTLP
ncbi:hypothetical protein CS063_14705, partial [Sporanaerobium hydrogeniformans]